MNTTSDDMSFIFTLMANQFGITLERTIELQALFVKSLRKDPESSISDYIKTCGKDHDQESLLFGAMLAMMAIDALEGENYESVI